jgi:5-methylcytosine-specific restriction enzyme A
MNATVAKESSRQSSAQRGYGHRWRKARLTFLTNHPLCASCQRIGRITSATLVDHIIPHRGDQRLFWDVKNWQSLCARCHSSIKQREEITGIVVGVSVDGEPTDPNHHWNRGR